MPTSHNFATSGAHLAAAIPQTHLRTAPCFCADEERFFDARPSGVREIVKTTDGRRIRVTAEQFGKEVQGIQSMTNQASDSAVAILVNTSKRQVR